MTREVRGPVGEEKIMMSREHGLPELARRLEKEGVLGAASKKWKSNEGFEVEMFSGDQAKALNEDLELWHKMPGWLAIGQDGDDALLCVESKTGRCALVEIGNLCPQSAQELATSLQGLLRHGRWLG